MNQDRHKRKLISILSADMVIENGELHSIGVRANVRLEGPGIVRRSLNSSVTEGLECEVVRSRVTRYGRGGTPHNGGLEKIN